MCLKYISDWLFSETDNLTTLIGYLFILIGIRFGVHQWREEQKWKRKQAVLDRINAFNDTPGALNAVLMLDWADRNIPLWAKDRVEDRFIRIKRKEVATSLIPDNLLKLIYSPKEDAIRDSFEDYLIKLSHLELFIQSALFTESEAKPVMDGFIKTLNTLSEGDDMDRALLRHLYLYITHRDFSGLPNLLRRFNIDIYKEVEEAQRLIQTQIANGEWIRA